MKVVNPIASKIHIAGSGIRNRESIDSICSGTNDGGFSKCTSQQIHCGSHIILQQFRHDIPRKLVGYTQHDSDDQLRQGFLFQSREKLGTYLVSGSEEEQIKENIFYDQRYLNFQLPNNYSGQQGTYHDPKTEQTDFNSTDQNPAASVRKITSFGCS